MESFLFDLGYLKTPKFTLCEQQPSFLLTGRWSCSCCTRPSTAELYGQFVNLKSSMVNLFPQKSQVTPSCLANATDKTESGTSTFVRLRRHLSHLENFCEKFEASVEAENWNGKFTYFGSICEHWLATLWHLFNTQFTVNKCSMYK